MSSKNNLNILQTSEEEEQLCHGYFNGSSIR